MKKTLTAGFVAAIMAIAGACSADDPTGPPNILTPAGHARETDALLDADKVLAGAVAGRVVRGEQDDMLKREKELPGFGGFFIDSADQVVVYMKRSAGTPDEVVRRQLVSAYATRAEARIREVMPHAANARILDGDYTLSELIAIENRISHSPVRIPGYVGVGTSLMKNRVVLGFTDTSSVSAGLAMVSSLGAPLAAIVPEVWGEMKMTSRWADAIRPLEGGIKLAVMNHTERPAFEEGGSVGFNVTHWTGQTATHYFLTAAHVPNVLRGLSGIVGDTVVQPGSQFPPAVGIIVNNPAWDSNCGQMNAHTGRPYDYCVNSDAVLASYLGTVTGESKIGTSMYEGLNGEPSRDDQINNWYPISGVATPEFISTTNNGVHKSGFYTGTTTGQLVLPDVQAEAHTCWGTPSCNLADPNQGIWVLYWNLTKVAHAGWGYGDSGGPVFAGNASPYYALGIDATGTGTDDGRICIDGLNCAFYFSRWSFIEQDIGIGGLDPSTSQLPPQTLAVSVTGPSTVSGCTSATWTATATGGNAPIAYVWNVEDAMFDTGTNNHLTYTNTGSTPSIFVHVTATDNSRSSATFTRKTNVSLPGAC